MGLGKFFRKLGDDQAEITYFFDLGCEVMGRPSGGYWRSTLMERVDRVNAGRKEHARRQRYPLPSRENGYYSQDRGTGTFEQFIGKDGDLTAERPHIHIIHSEAESRIIFKVTQSDGRHTNTEHLPIGASGSEVNAVISRLRRELR